MFWVVGAFIGVGVLAWLSYEEQMMCRHYNESVERFIHETKQRQQQTADILKKNALKKDYYSHLTLYRASVTASNKLYQIYDNHKQLVKIFTTHKNALWDKICLLKEKRNQSTGNIKKQIIAELQSIYEKLHQIKDELNLLYNEKSKLLSQIRMVNQETHQIKLYIRDNCGVKGYNWYQRKTRQHQKRC